MNSLTVPIVILILIITVGILVFSFTRSSKDSADSGKIIPPSGGGSVDTKKCPVSIDAKTLVSCDPSDPNSCNMCSDGLHACFAVTDQEPYKISVEGSIVNIPNGNWCLPAKVKSLPCNEFSGFPILARLTPTEYAWKCQCKYPSLFENEGEFGDCTAEIACGAQLNDKNHLVCPPNSDACTPGTKWLDNPTWDPTAGVCSCDTGLKFVDKSNPDTGVWDKECLADSCTPGVTEGNSCKCPDKVQDSTGYTSFIRCPDDVLPQKQTICNSEKQCVKDPCNPGGYYDPTNPEKCVCLPGYKPTENETSLVGRICNNPCGPSENPCGERGDCIIVDGKAQCTNCKWPWLQTRNYVTCDPNNPDSDACKCVNNPNMCMCMRGKFGEECVWNAECLSGHCPHEYHHNHGYCNYIG